MFRNYRDRVPSTDSESDNAIFNNAFQSSSAISTTFNSTNFTSEEAILQTDTDESDLRRLIENDTFLKNVSKNDSLSINRGRSPSLIIAAGTAEGSTANTSIESLQSTILDGALDTDTSFYSPSATLTNVHLFADHLLDKRISTEDEFTDCESSPESQTKNRFSTYSTNYKSLRLSYSPSHRSANNNIIFKETGKSADSQPSENSDSGLGSNAASNFSSKCPGLPPYLQHLTTILEESTFLSNANSKRISGLQLMPLINDLRKGPMPDLPQTVKFNETITNLAQMLDKSSREITVDQLAQILLYTLQTDYSYGPEHLSETDSLLSYAEISKLSGIDSNNTGMELDSIIRQLRSIYRPEKNIESESSPDWHTSLTITISKTPRNTLNQDKIPQGSRRMKEFFPTPPFSNFECNKENFNLQRTGSKEIVTVSPKKNKVRFSPKVCQFAGFNESIDKPQKKKYVATPRFKQNEDKNKPNNINSTTGSDDSFLYWEQKAIAEEKKSRRNLRRSLSMSNILTDESTTFEVSKLIKRINLRSVNEKLLQKTSQFAENKTQERTKKYRKRRSRSLENNGHLLVQTNFGFNNDSSRNNPNMPSTSGIHRKRFSNQQKSKNFTQKLTVKIGDISSRKTQTQSKIQQKKGKNSINYKSPNKISHNRKSSGIDSSHIPAVSQLRKVFSPARKVKGLRDIPGSIPRIEITKSSPEKSVNSNPTPIMELRRKRILRSNSQEKNSSRKPWRP